jgi:hypothetical protein
MIHDTRSIQAMMRALVIATIEKFNNRIRNNSAYNAGIARAYCSILNLLYTQAKLFHIPLHYLSLDTIDPEKASFSNDIIHLDENLPIPEAKELYKTTILAWLSDNKSEIKEIYKDFLPDAENDEFYQAMITGYEEIFALMEKYGIGLGEQWNSEPT